MKNFLKEVTDEAEYDVALYNHICEEIVSTQEQFPDIKQDIIVQLVLVKNDSTKQFMNLMNEYKLQTIKNGIKKFKG